MDDQDNVSNDVGVRVVDLAASVEPLKERFNANQDKVRFVALVSPT